MCVRTGSGRLQKYTYMVTVCPSPERDMTRTYDGQSDSCLTASRGMTRIAQMLSDSSQHVWASAGILTTSCLRISIVLGTKHTKRNLHLYFMFSLSCFLYFHPYLRRLSFVWGACIWLRHCTTRRKAACSIPDGVTDIFHWLDPSGSTMALGSVEPPTEKSTRSISWGTKGGRCVWLTNLPPSCSECLEILGVSTT
jgi:hypothetical protein